MKRISRENIFKNLTDIYLLLQIKVFYIYQHKGLFLKIKSEPLIINTNFYDKYQHINHQKVTS